MTLELAGILILGAGGHAKVVADILQQQGKPLAGFLDDNPSLWGTIFAGFPVHGAIHDIARFQPTGLIVGIGSNRARKQVVDSLGAVPPELWVNAIHPRAIVADSVRVGRGIVIAAGAVINPDAILGNHIIVNTTASIDHDCSIGDYVHLAPGSHLAGEIQVGEGALVGVGAVVIPGITIGGWTVIAAGAAVVRDIPAHVVAKGVPARWT